MTSTSSRSAKFAFFMLGIALPIAGFVLWSKAGCCQSSGKKAHMDEKRDITVEDSFPASDPPSSW